MPDYRNELTELINELNRSVAANKGNEPRCLDQILTMAVQRNASDILIVAGSPVIFRINGVLTQVFGPVSATGIRDILLPLLTNNQQQELHEQRSIDFSFVQGVIGRFRANFHHQRGTLAAAIRLLPTVIPSLESLHLPASLARLTEPRHGLILVTGAAGSGKTSTLAALINQIDLHRHEHIITIEDPIEFQYTQRNSLVEQIEVQHDTPSFARAVRSVLRQDPDVILVGEIRDSETLAAVLTAAETGHLVLSSLHTNDAAQTISRVLDSFPSSHQPQIRQQLSLALLAVISQQLLPTAFGNIRYPAVEIMVATNAIRNLIRRGEDHQIRAHIEIGRAQGMLTMEQSLVELVRTGIIAAETARAHCYLPADLERHLKT